MKTRIGSFFESTLVFSLAALFGVALISEVQASPTQTACSAPQLVKSSGTSQHG